MNNKRMVFVASVMGENENYFAIMDANDFDTTRLGDVVKAFKESASKYFLVDKKYCDVMMSYATSIEAVAALEANNRADGYFKDMDKKCFAFLYNAVQSVKCEQTSKELYKMLGSLADLI